VVLTAHPFENDRQFIFLQTSFIQFVNFWKLLSVHGRTKPLNTVNYVIEGLLVVLSLIACVGLDISPILWIYAGIAELCPSLKEKEASQPTWWLSGKFLLDQGCLWDWVAVLIQANEVSSKNGNYY
jgi:hypothetical protein